MYFRGLHNFGVSNMGKISDIIDSRLNELGIKGSKMCDDLGISRSTLTELRKDRATTLKADRAAAIANYLGVTVEYLLGRTDEPYMHRMSPENSLRGVADPEERRRRISREGHLHREDWDFDDDGVKKEPAVPKDDELTHAIILGRNGKAIRRTYSPEDMEAVYRLLDALPHKDEDI